MKSIRWDKLLLLGTTLSCTASSALAQGFVNLDFEFANLTPAPTPPGGGLVPITDALPGWTGYLGTNQFTQVLQNNYTLGSALIDIFGPGWNNSVIQIIEGEYSVALQAGFVGTNMTSTTIAQTGLVPLTARSLQFKGSSFIGPQPFEVTLGGQTLSMTPLMITSTYTLYGGDITTFHGQTHELRITALPVSLYFTVDSIEFSPQIVPEPSALGLFALGGLLFSRLKRKQVSRR